MQPHPFSASAAMQAVTRSQRWGAIRAYFDVTQHAGRKAQDCIAYSYSMHVCERSGPVAEMAACHFRQPSSFSVFDRSLAVRLGSEHHLIANAA